MCIMGKVSPTETLNTGVYETAFFIQTQAKDIKVHKYEIYTTDLNLSAKISQA